MPDEKELARKIMAGDAEAQARFYRENARRLYHICIHFLGPEDDEVEDIVQQAFLVTLEKMPKFEFRSTLYTWLSNTCAHLCLERLRRRKKMLAAQEKDLERLTAPAAPVEEDPEKAEIDRQKRLELLQRLTQSLSDRCRRILELRDQRAESYINMSLALKIPMGTVMSQLSRCRKALRNLFDAEWKGGRP